jgi:hypothetical protein
MKILLYNPDNKVTNSLMPHLSMFFLKPPRPRLDITNDGQPNLWLTPALFCAERSKEGKSVSEVTGWKSREFPGYDRATRF